MDRLEMKGSISGDNSAFKIFSPPIRRTEFFETLIPNVFQVIQYKLLPDRREAIKQVWWDRLQGCQPNVEDWNRIIRVHSLVLTPREDMRLVHIFFIELISPSFPRSTTLLYMHN